MNGDHCLNFKPTQTLTKAVNRTFNEGRASEALKTLTELQRRAKGATKTAAHIPLEVRCPFLHSQRQAVSPLSVVPLKIVKNNCKPGETHRGTPFIHEIPTL
jgi:hypothetical protein